MFGTLMAALAKSSFAPATFVLHHADILCIEAYQIYQKPEQIRNPRYTCSCRHEFVTFDDSDNETLIQPCRLL